MIAGLLLCTGISFVSTQIITDVFPAISVLSIWHLLFNDKLSKGERWGLFGLFFLANATHFSHLLFHTALLILLLLLRNQKSLVSDKRSFWKNWGLLLVLTWLAILTMGSSLSKSKHNFYMARMAESGLLQDYLAEVCPDTPYRLCEYQDQIPRNANLFLWDTSSPLYTYGSWRGSKDEFGEIISDSFRRPKYLFRHIWEAIVSSLRQMGRFEVGDGNIPFVEGSQIYERIQLYVPGDAGAYIQSRQSKGKVSQDQLGGLNIWFNLVMILSLLGILGMWVVPGLRKVIPLSIRFFSIYLLGVYILNASINASLVTLADRFGTKLAWLIPLAFVFLLLAYLHSQKSPQD